MKPRLLRQAVRYVVGWGVAIFFVVLLTLIFSFLGTIICAALTGMMIGAARLPRWQALAISLIFPAVIVSVLRTSGADLSANQIGLLALLCLAAYWLIYAVVAAMMNFEHRAQDSGIGQRKTKLDARLRADRGHGQSTLVTLNLHALEGKWRAEPNGCQLNGHQKVLEFASDTMRLSLTGSDGRVNCCLCAQLDLSAQSAPTRLNVFCQGCSGEEADTLICI